jgi:hypothetical protein
MFRGRAADKMTDGVPRCRWDTFNTCPYENPLDPSRVHIDSFGNVIFCQGIAIGNVWATPLPELMDGLSLADHPVCGPLSEGGPAELASRFEACTRGTYVDACHLCFEVRRSRLEELPDILAPRQVYGIEQ